MKKIRLLHSAMLVFIILGVLGIIGNLFAIFLGQVNLEEVYKYRNFGILTPFVSMLITALIIFGVFEIKRALYGFLQNSYFNSKSAKHLKRGGMILVLSSICAVANGIINGSFVDKESFILSSMIYALLLIIGIAVLAVSDMINIGEVIEQENLLTI
jgi:hypothetical protein